MAKPGRPEGARFFTAILASGPAELAVAAVLLEDAFGPAASGSRVFPFENTDYYQDELGPEPLRAFLAWPGQFSTDDIARRKLVTNDLEITLADRLANGFRRPVNLDPGYITLAKVVLASAKNFAHRIHLHDNIYAEITLQYKGTGFHSLPWTFPDYASGRYDGFFHDIRKTIPPTPRREQ
ncbi:MAG: DUF4416 family protein [Planctomycetes bacterium]|nr:DUF4416 family protein [Planctomycetota bacterium]